MGRAVGCLALALVALTVPAGAAHAHPTRGVEGTLVRTVSEAPGADDVTTWLRTPAGRVVPLDDVRSAAVTSVTAASTTAPTTASAAASTAAAAAAALTTPTPPSGLVQSVTVVLARPPGTTPDATTAQAVTTAVEGASAYWSGQSGGRIRFAVTTALGWTPVTATCADTWGLWRQAAAAAGFVEGPRRHLLVYVAADPTCAPGLATIGTGPDTGGSLYVRSTQVELVAHELGHNLGLGHSNGLQCAGAADAAWSPAASAWSRPCVRTDYRDWYDLMGVSWGRFGTLSTAHAYRLGLLAGSQVATVTTPAVVVLRPVGSATGVVSARVQDPAGATYVVEYRPATGLDAWLASPSLNWRGLRAGVLVRRIDPSRGSDLAQTLLLDPTPSPAAAQGDDFDQALVSGGRLTTASGRVTISVGPIDASPRTAAAVMTVSMDGRAPDAQLARLGAQRTTVNPAPVAVPWRGTVPVHP